MEMQSIFIPQENTIPFVEQSSGQPNTPEQEVENIFTAFIEKLRGGKELIGSLEDLQQAMPPDFQIEVFVKVSSGNAFNKKIDKNTNVHTAVSQMTQGKISVERKSIASVLHISMSGVGIDSVDIYLYDSEKSTVANVSFTDGNPDGVVDFPNQVQASELIIVSTETYKAGKEYSVSIGQQFHLDIFPGKVFVIDSYDVNAKKYILKEVQSNGDKYELTEDTQVYFDRAFSGVDQLRIRPAVDITFPTKEDTTTTVSPTEVAQAPFTPELIPDHARNGSLQEMHTNTPFRMEHNSTSFVIIRKGSGYTVLVTRRGILVEDRSKWTDGEESDFIHFQKTYFISGNRENPETPFLVAKKQ